MDRDSVEYDEKLSQMKSYLPFLESMEKRLKTSSGDGIGIQLSKIQGLKNLLLGSKRMKMENLRKCEQVLIKLHQKTHEKKFVESSSDVTNKVLEECDTVFENNKIKLNLNSSKVVIQNKSGVTNKVLEECDSVFENNKIKLNLSSSKVVNQNKISLRPVHQINVNYSTVVSQLNVTSLPVASQMKVDSSLVAGHNVNSSPGEVHQMKAKSSTEGITMNANTSPAVSHINMNSLPVAGYLNASFSPVVSRTNANSSSVDIRTNANFSPAAHPVNVDVLPVVNQISPTAAIHINSPPGVNQLNVNYSPIHSYTNLNASPVVSRMNMNFYKENTEPVAARNDNKPDSNIQTEVEVVSSPPKDLESVRAKLMGVVALAVPTPEVVNSATHVTKLYEKEIQYVTTKFIQKQIGSDANASHHISECEAFIKQCKSKSKGGVSEKAPLSKELPKQRFYTRSLRSPVRFPAERKGRSRRKSRSFSPNRSNSKDSYRSRDSGGKRHQSPKSSSERYRSNAPARNSSKEYEKRKPSSDRNKNAILSPIKKSWEQQVIDKRINLNRIERKTSQENNKELSELRKKREKLVLELQEENLFEALANVSELPNEEVLYKKKRNVDKEDGEIGESEEDDEKCIKMLYENLPSNPIDQKHFTNNNRNYIKMTSTVQNDTCKLDHRKEKQKVDRKSTNNEGNPSAEILLNLKTNKLENNKKDIEFLLKERGKKANEKLMHNLNRVDGPVKGLEKDNLHHSVKKTDETNKDTAKIDNKEVKHSIKPFDTRTPEVKPMARVKSIPKISLLDVMADIITSEIKPQSDQTEALISNMELIGQAAHKKNLDETLANKPKSTSDVENKSSDLDLRKPNNIQEDILKALADDSISGNLPNLNEATDILFGNNSLQNVVSQKSRRISLETYKEKHCQASPGNFNLNQKLNENLNKYVDIVNRVFTAKELERFNPIIQKAVESKLVTSDLIFKAGLDNKPPTVIIQHEQKSNPDLPSPIKHTPFQLTELLQLKEEKDKYVRNSNIKMNNDRFRSTPSQDMNNLPPWATPSQRPSDFNQPVKHVYSGACTYSLNGSPGLDLFSPKSEDGSFIAMANLQSASRTMTPNVRNFNPASAEMHNMINSKASYENSIAMRNFNQNSEDMMKLLPSSRLMSPSMMNFNAGSAEQINAANSEYEMVHQQNRCEPLNSPRPYAHLDFPVSSNYKGKHPKPLIGFLKNQNLRGSNVISPDYMRDPNHIVPSDMNIVSNAGYQCFNDRNHDVAKSYNQDPQSEVGFTSRMGRVDYGNYMNENQFGSPSGSQISMRFDPRDERCNSISDSRGYSMHGESGPISNDPYKWSSQQREPFVGRFSDRAEYVRQNSQGEPIVGRTFERRQSVGQNFQREPSVGRTFNREQSVGRTYREEQSVGRSTPREDYTTTTFQRESSVGRSFYQDPVEDFPRNQISCSRSFREASIGRSCNFESNEIRARFGNPSSRFQRAQSVGRILNSAEDRCMDRRLPLNTPRAREGSVGRSYVRGKSVGPASSQDVDYRCLNPELKFQRGQSVGRSLHIFKGEINSSCDSKLNRFQRGRSVGRFTEISDNRSLEGDRNRFKKDNHLSIFSHSDVDERTALFNHLKTQQIAFNENRNKSNINVFDKQRSIKDPRLRHLQEKELESKKSSSSKSHKNDESGSNKDNKKDRRTEKYSDPRRNRIDSKHESRNHRKERDSSKSSRRSKDDNSKSRDDKSRRRSSPRKESFSKSKNSMLHFKIPKLKKDEDTESTKTVETNNAKQDIDERKSYFMEKIPESKTTTPAVTSMDKKKIKEDVSDFSKINEDANAENLGDNLKDKKNNLSKLNDDLKNESPQKNQQCETIHCSKKDEDSKDELIENVSTDEKLHCSNINKDSRIESSESEIAEEKSDPTINADSNKECLENGFNSEQREDTPQTITESKENNGFKGTKRLSNRLKIKDHVPEVDLSSDRKLRDRSKINKTSLSKNVDNNCSKEKRPSRLSKVCDSDVEHEKSPIKNKPKKAVKKKSVESNKPDMNSTETSDPVNLINLSNTIDGDDTININQIDAADRAEVNTSIKCLSAETKFDERGLATKIDTPLPSKDVFDNNKENPVTSPDDVEQSQTISEKVSTSILSTSLAPEPSENPKEKSDENNPKETNDKEVKGMSDINSLMEILKNKNKMLEILELLNKTEDQTVSNKIRKRIEKLAEIESDDDDNVSEELSVKLNTKTDVKMSDQKSQKETVFTSEATVEVEKISGIIPNVELSVPDKDITKSPETGDKPEISSQVDELNKNNINIEEDLEKPVQKCDVLLSLVSNEPSIVIETPLELLKKTDEKISESCEVEEKSDPLNSVPILQAADGEEQESNVTASTEIIKPKRKYTRGNRELEMLHEYNLGMFISQDVLKATGVRSCTKASEMPEKKSDQEKKNNESKKGTKKINAKSSKANTQLLKNKNSTLEKMAYTQNSIPTTKLCVIIDKVNADDYKKNESRDVYEYDDSNHEVQEYETFKQKPCPKSKKVLNPNTTMETNMKATSSIDSLENTTDNQIDPPIPSSDLPIKPNRFRKCKLANNLNAIVTKHSSEKVEGKVTTLIPEVIKADIKTAKKIKKRPILSLKDEAGNSKKKNITAKPTIRKKKKFVWQTGVIRKKPIKKVIKSTPRKRISEKPTVNYISKSYHFSPDKLEYECKLCHKYKGSTIINHFKTKHPHSEVFISRLHPEQAKLAFDESKLTVVSEDKVSKKFKQYRCRFCMCLFKVKHLRSVFEHIALNHTGEYKSPCNLCASKDIVSCVSVCNRSSTLPPVFDGNNSVKGFMCSLCNYTQLSHENLKTHITLRHFHKECELIEVNLTQPNARRRRNHAHELAGIEKRKNATLSEISEKTDKESDSQDDVHSSKSVTVNSIEEAHTEDTLLLQVREEIEKETNPEYVSVPSVTVQQSEPAELPNNLQLDDEVRKIPEVPIKKEIICHEHDSLADANNTPEVSLLEVKKEVPVFVDEPSVPLINDCGGVAILAVVEPSVPVINNSVRAQTPTIRDISENVKNEVLSPVKPLDVSRDYVQVGAIQRKFAGDSTKYLCFINNCTFTSQFLFIFSRHLDQDHSKDKWDGFCGECGKYMTFKNQRFEYELALDHLLHVHVNDNNSETNETSNTDAFRSHVNDSNSETNETSNTDAVRSHVNDSNSETNETSNTDAVRSDLSLENTPKNSPKKHFVSKIQVRPMTDLMTMSGQAEMSKDTEDPLISETGICHLRIENVVSLNPNIIENQRLAESPEEILSSPSSDKEMLSPIPPPPPLKPAPPERVIISNCKLLQSSPSSFIKIAPKPRLRNPPQLVAANPKIIKYNMRSQQLFKCSTSFCSFSTSQIDEYTEHLIGHERSGNVDDWNECMYCEFNAAVPHQLAHHVLEEHGACRFECPQCSYRAAAPVLVMTHSVAMHRSKLSAIGEVETHPDAAEDALIRGLMSRRACIKPYVCTYDFEGAVCGSQFYTSDNFQTHCQQHKRTGCHWLCSECELAPKDEGTSEPPMRYGVYRLLNHLRVAHSFRLLACAYCANSYESQTAALGHLALMHPSRRPLLYLRVWAKPKEVGDFSDKVVLLNLDKPELYQNTTGQNLTPKKASPGLTPFEFQQITSIEKASDIAANVTTSDDRWEIAVINSGSIKVSLDNTIKPATDNTGKAFSKHPSLGENSHLIADDVRSLTKSPPCIQLVSDGTGRVVVCQQPSFSENSPLIPNDVSTKAPPHTKLASEDIGRALPEQASFSENSHVITDDVSTKAPPSIVTLASSTISEVAPIISTNISQVPPKVPLSSTVKPGILLKALQKTSPSLTTVLSEQKETVISNENPTVVSETSPKKVTRNNLFLYSPGKRTLVLTKVTSSATPATAVKPTATLRAISPKSADKMTSVLKPCTFNPFGLKNNSFNEPQPPVPKADNPIDPVDSEEKDVDVINLDSDDDVPLAVTKTAIDQASQIVKNPSESVVADKTKIPETLTLPSDKEGNQESDYSVEFLSDDEAAVVSALIGEDEEKEEKKEENSSSNESRCFTTMSESGMMKLSKNTGLYGKDLFRCGNHNCKYSLENSSEFKDHLAICENAKEQNKLCCFHCNRKFKHNVGLLDHVRMHGTHRYQCNICFYLSHSSQSVVCHMRKAHKTTVTHVVPVNPFKTNDDTDFFIVKASENIATSKGKRKKPGPTPKTYAPPIPSRPETPTKSKKNSFGPDEIDNLPWNPILTYEIKCAVCGFGTKVRSNMLRHLQMHSNEIAVPSVAPINPVPHLESNEMHFDKMANLALSSNIDRLPQVRSSDKKDKTDLAKPFVHPKNVPQFIPEKERFVCGSKSCRYISVDEMMLRYHWEALHREETVYHCTHCGEHVSEGNRALSTAHIASHLRLHEESLIGCEHCSFIHPQTRVVERHSLEAHGRSSSRCLRSLPGAPGVPGTPPAASDPGEMELRSWHCSLCPTKTTFKSDIVTHCKNVHSARNQFKCALCSFGHSTRNTFDAHFSIKHPGRPVDIQTIYTRGDEQLPVDNSPLWWKQRKRGSTFTEEVPSSPEPNKLEQPPLKKKRTSVEAGEIVKIKEEKLDDDLEILSVSTPKKKVDEIKIVPNTKLLNSQLSLLKTAQEKTAAEKVLRQTQDLLAQNIKKLNPPAKVAEEIIPIKQEFPSTNNTNIITPVNHNIIQILPTFGEPEEDRFSCPFCEKFTSKSSPEMRLHFYEEMNYRPFVCPVCAYKSFNETRILEHSKETHGTAQAQVIIGDPKVELWVTDCLLAQTKSINIYLAKVNTETARLRKSVPDGDDSSSDERLVIVEVDKSKAVEGSPQSQSPIHSVALIPPLSSSRPNTPSQPFTSNAQSSPTKQNLLSANISPKKLNKPDKSKCPYCDFESHSGIRMHIMRHWKVKPLKCGYCDFMAIRKIELRPHIARIHPGEPYLAIKNKLPEIQEIIQVGMKKNQNQHVTTIKTANIHKPFMCLKCEHSLDSDEIREHEVQCHTGDKDAKIMPKKSIVYKCIICMQLTPDIPSVMEHCRREHPNQEMNYVMHKLGNPKSKKIMSKDAVKIVYKYCCLHCQVKTQSFCELLDHHKNSHPTGQIYIKPLEFCTLESTGEIKTTLAPGVNECFIQGCQALLPNPTALKFHLRSHYMVYSCQCLSNFHTYENYTSHVKQHSCTTRLAMKHTFTGDLVLHDRLMQLFSLFKSLNSSFPGHYKDFIVHDEDDEIVVSSSQTDDSDCICISDSLLDNCVKPTHAKSQVARKSTTNVGGLLKRLKSSDDDDSCGSIHTFEDFSYYKTKPAALNLKKIKVEMLFLDKLRSFTVEQLSSIENINPIVLVKDHYNKTTE